MLGILLNLIEHLYFRKFFNDFIGDTRIDDSPVSDKKKTGILREFLDYFLESRYHPGTEIYPGGNLESHHVSVLLPEID